ncbi:hypothetical protein [Fredinandcohnia sp. 179-A 10B2 NHS]|uniref:hypothetical protein n=1 Tax=Fredinandcohnia sp. 179-A 10B2 NHS TaxID=3235176 RepID=UPI0039A251D6
MENITLEQVEKEEKKRSKKDFLIAIPTIAVAFGSIWAYVEGMEYLQIKTFSTEDSFLTVTISSFLYHIMIVILFLLIFPMVGEFILSNRSKLTVKQLMKRVLVLAIPCIPVMYLSFYSYIDIGEQSITYDPFWPGEKKTYAWEDIESVVIDEASYRNKRFDYYVNFIDGTSLDIWGDTRMNIEELKLVDDKVRANGIPKYINEPPYEKGLKDAYGDHPEEYKIVQQVISE